ncbi:MAG: hypothetical protein ABW042_04525 [Phenylobacterium sp.]
MPQIVDEQIARNITRIRDKAKREHFEARFEAQAAKQNLEAPPSAEDERARAELLAETQREANQDGRMWLTSIGLISGVTIAGLLLILAIIFGKLSFEEMVDPRMARPVIMLAMIVAMLGFGAFLIFRPMLMTEPAEQVEQKFRLAREVFLIFSGIFATVVGFYFGALEGGDSDDMSQAATVAVALDHRGIAATLAGGPPPYTAALVMPDGSRHDFVADPDNASRLILAPGSAGAVCPEGGVLEASSGGVAVTPVPLPFDAKQLGETGWEACGEPAAEPAAAEPAGESEEPAAAAPE